MNSASVPVDQFVDFITVKGGVDSLLDNFALIATKCDGILGSQVKEQGFPSKMLWQPLDEWSGIHDDEVAHLRTLVIPAVPCTNTDRAQPDMLLYALGEFRKVDEDIDRKLEQVWKNESIIQYVDVPDTQERH